MHVRRLTMRLAVACLALLGALVGVGPAAAADPAGLVCSDGPTFNLTARAGGMETPDGNTNLMWSYSTTAGHFQTPGPVLCVDAGDTVTVHLRNELPEATSIVFPGQTGVSATGGTSGLFTKEAAPGGDITYTFTANTPGTYVYESGTDPAKQVEMGLASALVVRPPGHADWAYADSSTAFNGEFLVLLNEIDPELHSAVENGQPYDISTLHNRYYTINGRSFPDTLQDNGVPWLENQPYGSLVHIKPYDATLNKRPALVRVLNVGLANHPFHPHGESLQFIAQDGRQIKARTTGNDAVTEHFGETVPSGSTQDFLLSFRDQDSFAPGNPVPVTFPSYRDMTFKDNNTWYSGSPYLGTVGKLPSPTVSQNVCGAFFFPWHSHALNEFANYDVAFGGMATLLRVDPLTGCGTPGLQTYTGSPASVTRTSPTPVATVSNGQQGLAALGGTRTDVTSNTSGTTRRVEWYATFTGVPAAGVNLKVAYSGYNRLTGFLSGLPWGGCTQTVRIWNWTTSAWVNLNTQTVQRTQVDIADLLPAGPDTKYIGTGGNGGEVRVGVACTRTFSSSFLSATFVSSGDLMQITYDAP